MYRIEDPDFITQFQLLSDSYPALWDLSLQIHDCLKRDLQTVENNAIQIHVEELLGAERQNRLQDSQVVEDLEKQTAFEVLVEELKKSMEKTLQ